MLLKNIKMKGFKSFANRVKVDFKPSVTGVIGPNGSGKSNIADAIRWVLGEQSAKALRGSKMKDVIFAGSDKRRALSKAEVSLTLDNSDGQLDIDYDQVTITRRVTKDGRSDYLINNNRCRLKDIRKLLLDTGMGKEAYSIIGQGKVESILNGQAADRRGLFEEAAGITKHKQRKEEAVSKLEDNQQNLQRIEDIVSEVERQLGPLEKEATKAKEYKEYQAELEEIEVNLLLNKYAQLEEELDEKIAAKQQLSYQLTNVKAKVSEYDVKISNYEEDVEDLTSKIEERRSRLFTVKSEVEGLKNKLELAVERKGDLGQQKDKLSSEIKEARNKIELAQQKIKDQQKKEDQLADSLITKKNKLKSKQEKLEQIKSQLAETTTAKEEMRDNRLQQANQINQQEHRLETIKKELARYQKQIAGTKESKVELEKKLEEVRENKKDKSQQLEQIKADLSSSQQRYQAKVSKKKEVTAEFKELENEYDTLKHKIDNKKSRLEALEGLAENYAGYYRGVKSLLQVADRGRLTGICGVVAELIEVDKDYETAIEVALGSALQNVIVEDDKVGEEAINYLKENNKGRATLLPLNLINPRSLRNQEKKALELEGALGVAAQLINYDSKYDSAIKNLLGRVIIATNTRQAVEISKAANQRVKVVTLDGEVIRPGGAMTGGSYNRDNNLLGRSREINELKSKVEDLDVKLEEIGNLGIEKKDQIMTLDKELQGLSSEIHQLELQQATVDKDYQQLKGQANRLLEEVATKDNKLDSLEQEVTTLKEQKEDLATNLNQLNTANSLEDSLAELAEEIKVLERKKEEVSNNITDLKIEVASIEQQQKQSRQEIDKQQELIKQLKEEIGNKKSRINRIDNKAKQLANKKEELTAAKEEKGKKVVQLGEVVNKLQSDRKEFKAKIKETQNKSQEIREKLGKLQTEYNGIKVKLGQLEVKLDNIEEKLAQEYELEVYDKLKERKDVADYDQAESKIKELKSKMKKLEPVNLGAIAEYDSLSKRYSFLQEQHQDLIEAKESLQQVIAEIEEEMEEKFLATYQEVKAEFESIFVDLFEGGEAELSLTDSDNLLETEIKINAQPPGKKLQKLSLMSGGEKALTATALIFALLKVNPSPFYILDELDAPLDDANVNRFAQYLDKLSDKAQFIIITHRKGTMQVADALYGVTMEESGVSQLVSLELSDLAG
ncbi:chromosome segregation protein SMC [Halanaerocella petrolearia]